MSSVDKYVSLRILKEVLEIFITVQNGIKSGDNCGKCVVILLLLFIMEMTIPVTLIVKAPNQQIEDQTVKCELSWTISKLKGHLSEVYPSKPVCITLFKQILYLY